VQLLNNKDAVERWFTDTRRQGEVMSFRDTNLDDSPKSRVLQLAPKAKCKAVYLGGKIGGYVVSLRGKTLAAETTAYHAWRNAEAELTMRSK
jgi:hypothetical protein